MVPPKTSGSRFPDGALPATESSSKAVAELPRSARTDRAYIESELKHE